MNNKIFSSLIAITALSPALLSAASKKPHPIDAPYEQWFLGPLIGLTPTTPELGTFEFEPEIYGIDNYGTYNSHGHLKKAPSLYSQQTYFDFQFAISERIGIEIEPSYSANFSQGEKSFHLNDTLTYIGYQISTDQADSWIPDFRFLFEEIFPSGHFDHLNPSKQGTDSTGLGTYQSGFNFIVQKNLLLGNNHHLCLRSSIGYYIPTSVRVKGYNCYGGNASTNTTVTPGQYYNAYFAFEYELFRKIAIAFEANYLQGWKGKYKKDMDIAIPAYRQLTLAPEIEYTFTENCGFIGGLWFTAYGVNAEAFVSLFGAFSFTF